MNDNELIGVQKKELEGKDWEKRKMRYHHSVTNSRFTAIYFITLTAIIISLKQKHSMFIFILLSCKIFIKLPLIQDHIYSL